jgi:WS/DGAT/MGAT family acyltransferase
MSIFYQEWGSGDPVIALHPLALESTVFAGVGARLEGRGLRTLGADLPGFGQSPADDGALTAARLAEPVIELARSLETPPIILGMSLGGRVALEAALIEPGAFRGLALTATYLPWLKPRWPHKFAHLLSPALAERVPLQLAWPLLKRLSSTLDKYPSLQDDWLARASVRVAYYLACPATRRHFISATRELMLDPAYGPDAVWSRLPELKVPATFLWAGHDRLIPKTHAHAVAERLPSAAQLHVACCGHFVNGRHHRCFEEAMVRAIDRVIELEQERASASKTNAVPNHPQHVELCPCFATDTHEATETPERTEVFETPTVAKQPPVVTAIRPHNDKAARTNNTGDETRSMNDLPKHSSRRRLSGEDALFVFGETTTMPMHTMGTMILDPSTVPDGPFDCDRVIRTLKSRIHLMPPYRQRLVEVPLGLDRPLLIDDPDFQVENHIHRLTLRQPGTLRELADEVGQLAGKLLDRSRPLWEMWYVDGLADGRVALVTKMHHCMIDGASGADQMAGLLDLEPLADENPTPPAWNPDPLPSPLDLAGPALVPSVPDPIATASLLADTATGLLRRTAVRRERSSTLDAVTSVFSGAPRTKLGRALTPNRAVAFASASLADIKMIKQTFGVTVNDVVLAACTLAVRRYLEADDDLPSEPMLCAVPISMKTAAEKQEFSNKVATMTVKLPTDIVNAQQLLETIHDETEAAKREFFAVDGDLLMGWLDLAWPAAMAAGAQAFSRLKLADLLPSIANLVVSNMAGPPVPLYMAGAQVLAIYPMGPIGEGVGLNVTVLSNMDRVDMGLLACRETVPSLWEIAEGFETAVANLKSAAEQTAAA